MSSFLLLRKTHCNLCRLIFIEKRLIKQLCFERKNYAKSVSNHKVYLCKQVFICNALHGTEMGTRIDKLTDRSQV